MWFKLLKFTKGKIKLYFVCGLLFITPIAATLFVLNFIISLLNYPFSGVFHIKLSPVFGLLVSLILITFIGVITNNFIGKYFFGFLEKIIQKLPLVGKIYQSSKQIVDVFTLEDKEHFKPVRIQYPRKGCWAIAFLTSESAAPAFVGNDALHQKEMNSFVSVFIPTTPNPTSGFLIYLDRSEVVELDVSMEDAVKLLMSAGALNCDL